MLCSSENQHGARRTDGSLALSCLEKPRVLQAKRCFTELGHSASTGGSQRPSWCMAYIPVAAEKTIASLSHMKDGRHAREECVVVCGRKDG